ncbi:uncharacterized protein LOC142324494 [Lycorma delicatula]|uniref:uncharacterized protein LOC142324494 n=1 Tax=Lycorma delicatula TaxID=130591 RepID=UPI003F51039C
MKFNAVGFITTNAVLLSIIFFSIASAYPSILSKLKEERKTGPTAEEDRFRHGVLGAIDRRIPVFASDIAKYGIMSPTSLPKIPEDRKNDQRNKVIVSYGSQTPRMYGFRPRITGFEHEVTIFQSKIPGSESKLFNFGTKDPVTLPPSPETITEPSEMPGFSNSKPSSGPAIPDKLP